MIYRMACDLTSRQIVWILNDETEALPAYIIAADFAKKYHNDVTL